MRKSSMLVALALSLLVAASALAVGAQDGPRRALARRALLAGRVLAPDGSAAAGALVRAAGREALADADGAFELEVELAVDANVVEVTAVGAGAPSLSASARVVPSRAAAPLSAGNLVLAPSDDCHPRWLPTFGPQPGADGPVRALAVLDLGSGPALFAAGAFGSVNGVETSAIAKRVGHTWQTLGEGIAGAVYALAAYDDGSGPALFAAGKFGSAGGVPAINVARWDGASWSALGSGIPSGHGVQALAVLDDGSGPALYAGGYFTTAGGVAASNVARWDGASWSALGAGLGDGALCLAAFDDGSGPALYAGGVFTAAGGAAARRIARWDGAAWSALGGNTSGGGFTGGAVHALAAHDDGTGPALFAGGTFTTADGAPASRIARWDGASWSALGAGLSARCGALVSHDDGGGDALYAGGDFVSAGGVPVTSIARWRSASWSAVGDGMSPSFVVNALAASPGTPGTAALFAGASFGNARHALARWNGVRWSPLGRGVNDRVNVLEAYDLGDGLALYAGGRFDALGSLSARRVARWDGASWQALGAGRGGEVHSLAAFDAGNGPELHVGGYSMLDRWDGSGWVELANDASERPNGHVFVMTVFDDGGGSDLYAAGDFTEIGVISARGIARWDGASWSALGAGIFVSPGYSSVRALQVFDDGGGSALYAGGSFSGAGGLPAEGAARWDGAAWSALGSGPGFDVDGFAVFDGGGGAALHAGGATGFEAGRVARWDGAAWAQLGAPLGFHVRALAVHDDGSGPALYAAGGGDGPHHVARWDGDEWIALGAWGGSGAELEALAPFALDGVPALIAGGSFVESPAGDSHLARFGCPSKVRSAFR